MKTFNNQMDLTAYWEQGPTGEPALKAYKCPAGVWTIGYGETRPNGKPVTPDMTCTEEQAMEWLDHHFGACKYKLAQELIGTLAYQDICKLEALSDYAYNCGISAFPTLLKYLKAGDIELASHEFLDGIYAAGKPFLGLLLRRISEYNTFTTGEYKAFEKDDPITLGLKSLLLLKNGHNDAAVEMINRFKIKEI